jgi:hypothetical protein
MNGHVNEVIIMYYRWTHTATGDPIDSIRDTIFFKTIELAVTDGSTLVLNYCINMYCLIH